MKGPIRILALIALTAASGVTAAPLSDAQIAQTLIQQSIASYPGTCPCPYSTARNGSRCGHRSAYSRPGGYAPLCFSSDVTPSQIAAYRKEHAS